jgi:hypothetical protein
MIDEQTDILSELGDEPLPLEPLPKYGDGCWHEASPLFNAPQTLPGQLGMDTDAV